MANVSNISDSPEQKAYSYKLNNLSGSMWEKEEKLTLIVDVINSGAFRHLSFEENLEIDRVLTSNIVVNKKKVYGKENEFLNNINFKHERLESLNPNQVYYFLKDGLKFDRFLSKRGEDEAFLRVYCDSNKGLGVGKVVKGDLYLQHIVVFRAKVYGYFIGEDLAYLLAVRSNEILLSIKMEGFSREYRDSLYRRYLDECYIPYVNTIKNANRLSTRGIKDRDLFSEFEEGKIANRGKVTLSVTRPTIKERMYRVMKRNLLS